MADLPFDRGDTNRALVSLCHLLADGIGRDRPEFAESLRAGALKLSADVKTPGSPRKPLAIETLLRTIEQAWRALDKVKREQIKASGGLVGELGDILDAIRVLVIFCSPKDQGHLRLMSELRAIRESVRLGRKGHLLD
jgi:hypothetical protein